MTIEQIEQTLSRIDDDITALLRDGKLSNFDFLNSLPAPSGVLQNRAENLKCLLAFRREFQLLLSREREGV